MTSSSFNRPGAVDLSSLAQQSAQAPGGASYVVEVTEQNFDDVMRKSMQHPIIVELYSPRAQNSQQLSDLLASLANAAAGKYLLARVNADAAPRIVQGLGVQAVPTVVGVIGGQLAPLFQGVQPREQVEALIGELLAMAVTNGIVGTVQPVGGAAADNQQDESVPDPRFAAADAALERGDFAAARDEFDKLLQADPKDAEAQAGRAQAGLLARTTHLNGDQVMAAAAAHPDDLQAQLDAADVELASGDADAAFGRLLQMVRTKAGDDREQARLRLLELFETLGNTDQRVLTARRNLMSALF